MKKFILFCLVVLFIFGFSIIGKAATPECGRIVTTPGAVIEFDSDMNCSEDFTGTVLTIAADNVTVNGMGYKIVAPNAACIIRVEGANGVTLTGINAPGAGTGTGIRINNSTGISVSSCTVPNRTYGMFVAWAGSSSNWIKGNDFSNCESGICTYSTGDGNSYIDNNLSNASSFGIVIHGDDNPTILGNDFTNCARGILFDGVNNFSFGPMDLSAYNISQSPKSPADTVLQVVNSINVTLTGINASGKGTGKGIIIENSTGTNVSSCTVTNRTHAILVGDSSSSTQVKENDLSNCGVGIYSIRAGNTNSFIDNNLSNASERGIIVVGGTDTPTILGNNFTNCFNGLRFCEVNNFNFGPQDFSSYNISNTVLDVYKSANVTLTGINASGRGTGPGIVIDSSTNTSVSSCTVSQRGWGLVLVNAPTTRVYHNNIYGNLGWQVYSNSAIELSYGNEGNYWGRSCPEPLFIPGTDSSGTNILDSFPYGIKDAWEQGIEPGCLPSNVNRPPIANAGSDQTVEATSSGGALVTLNGTTSIDPDGDVLTFIWTGPFGTVTGPTPDVLIPLGINTSILTVSDGLLESSDDVIITVTDTTPPSLVVPSDITKIADGVTTPIILSEATAVDLVDGIVPITSDAPQAYPLGTTVVTFTAKDSHNNSATGTTRVTVTDQNPPVVTVSGVSDGADYTEGVIPSIAIEDNGSGVKEESITLDDSAYISGTEITTSGNHTLVVTATDYANNVTTVTVHFSLYVSSALKITDVLCEYSDSAQVIATLTARSNPVSGKTLTFKMNGAEVGSAITTADGIATLKYVINLPAGDYPIMVSFKQDDLCFLRASEGSTDLSILPEKTNLAYTGQLLVQYPSATMLAAQIRQDNDGFLGDLALAKVRFDVSLVNSDGTSNTVGEFTANCNTVGNASITQILGVGVYSIIAAIVDNGYYISASDTVMIPVYDPSGGFVTGGGWINVTNPDEGNLGRANLGFNVNYKHNQPTGNVEFQYKDGGIDLKSKQIDWLVISSKSAQMQGLGTIKGLLGTCTFRIDCTGNEQHFQADKFTIKIWNGTDISGEPIYKALNQDLCGGNISIKTK